MSLSYEVMAWKSVARDHTNRGERRREMLTFPFMNRRFSICSALGTDGFSSVGILSVTALC